MCTSISYYFLTLLFLLNLFQASVRKSDLLNISLSRITLNHSLTSSSTTNIVVEDQVNYFIVKKI